MANNKNLKPVRTTREAKERGRNGGKASGEARRRKANCRKTLNLLLTAKIDSTEFAPILESMGLDSTLESAMLMAQIKEAISGNTKAAYFVAQYAGQNSMPDEDIRNQEADTELKKASNHAVPGEHYTDEALKKLDEILKGVYENAVKQETE